MKFNEEIPKTEKRNLGRTDADDTPLEVHGRMKLKRGFKEHVREQIGRALGHNATLVERAGVWFDDVNGPRGGVDMLCRVTLVLSGLPNLHVEERGSEASEALDRLVPRLSRALTKSVGRHGKSAPKPTRAAKAKAPPAEPIDVAPAIDPSVDGKRVGRVKTKLQAAGKPVSANKAPEDAAKQKKGNAISHNVKRSTAGMAAALEESVGRPTRKSTRISSNRIKAASPLTVRTKSEVSSPSARRQQAK